MRSELKMTQKFKTLGGNNTSIDDSCSKSRMQYGIVLSMRSSSSLKVRTPKDRSLAYLLLLLLINGRKGVQQILTICEGRSKHSWFVVFFIGFFLFEKESSWTFNSRWKVHIVCIIGLNRLVSSVSWIPWKITAQ